MNPIIAVIPAILLLGVVVVMIMAIFQFDRLRWCAVKDFLSRFWPVDQRRQLLIGMPIKMSGDSP